MGEARRRREYQRAVILAEIEGFIAPATVWERNLVAELNTIPTIIVPRAPADQLSWARMKPRECHANCQWYAANDPELKSRSVDGWWKQPIGLYIHHSVIERDGQFICITPTPTVNLTEIEFIPDSKIVWRDVEGKRLAERNGKRIGFGLRINPERTIQEYTLVRDRVLAGMDPVKAGIIDDGDIG